jgi:hypothetical protein
MFEGYPDGFSILHSKVRRLEILILSALKKRGQENYNYLLANNLSDFIDDPDLKKYVTALGEIEKDVNDCGRNYKISILLSGSCADLTYNQSHIV